MNTRGEVQGGQPVRQDCSNCGHEACRQRGNYWFKESGLNNILLKDIDLYKCAYCGTEDPIIVHLNELMRLIATALTEKPWPLQGHEIRFLRKYLAMNQDTFANLLGSDKTVLSKWECDQQPIGAKSDRLIRAVVLSLGPGLKPEKGVRKFAEIDREPRSVRVELDPEEETYIYA